MTVHDGWSSYDRIAPVYASVAEQLYFAAPAAHLAGLLNRHATGALLDLGTGTGVVAAAAVRSGHRRRVIGCDLSLAMLSVARTRVTGASFAAAALPRLPFRDGAFNAIAASFILSHLPDVSGALAESRRVLGEEGWMGATAWATSAGESPPARLCDSIAHRFISTDSMQAATSQILASEKALSNLDAFAEVIRQSGFTDRFAEQKEFDIEVGTTEFLESRLISMSSRYMMAHLPAAAWETFVTAAERALHETFGSRLRLETRVNFLIARRAA